MADVRINPVGMADTDEGYITAITMVTGGSASALDTSQIASLGTITVSALAATQVVQNERRFSLVTG